MATMNEIAQQIVDAAGAAGGIDEVRRIAERGWPAREGQSVELCEAEQAVAKSIVAASAITINIYRAGGEWFGARWIGGEYDGCDALDIDDDASEDEARDAAMSMSLSAAGERTVTRVLDPS